MKVKRYNYLQVYVLILSILLGAGVLGFSQNDSLEEGVLQDSVLLLQQERSKVLLVEADSIQHADSVQQALLLNEINNLRTEDQKRKKELQARVDSMKKAQEERNYAIQKKVDSLRSSTPGVPVIIFGDTVFYIYSKLGPFSPSERARNISQKIEMLVDEHIFNESEMQCFENEESDDVLHGEMILFSITDRDAFWLGESRKKVAGNYSNAIKIAVASYYDRTGIMSILYRVGILILVLGLFFFGIRFLNKALIKFNGWLLNRIKPFIQGVKFKNYEFLSKEREEQVVKWLLNVLKGLIILLLIYLLLPTVFSIFPSTKGFASKLLGYILNPVKKFAIGIIGYIPELITIIIILLITRYFVRFLKFLSQEVESGKLQLPGFFPDWSAPTFNLLRIVIYAFSFILIFPYLPGSDSPVFQGVSVFLGLLISLGSSSAIGNIIAGLVITYMRPFKIGDRVKIGDTSGDVVEKTMLVTRLRTIKNEDVTIPNSSILNGSTINFSSNSKTLGLILNTTITIGYDVPWRKVHELLISAALKTEYVARDPKPFVLQTSLDDFYVSYQINAYTGNASIAAKIYSNLYGNIQDAFNEAGIEIMSPHYRAARDGNMTTVPGEYLSEGYESPSFNVSLDKNKSAQ